MKNNKLYDLDENNLDFENQQNYLSTQTIIKNTYIIDKVIAINSEGATYIAYDKNFNQKYFVREYMPINLAKRSIDNNYVLPNAEKRAQYKALMVDFIDLYKTLSTIPMSSGIIPIKEIFTENNTVYIIKDYIKLISLKKHLNKYPDHSLSWYQCKSIFLKINSILSKLHRYGIIHRGISPYNIFIDKLNNIYIDGFCISCVRTAHSELQAELYEGYSAPEQYQANEWQGTWTDVYSLAATLYTTLTNKILPPINERTNDNYLLLEKNKLIIPKEIAIAITKAIRPNYRLRTQTVEQFNLELIGEDFPGDNTSIYETSNLKQAKNMKKEDETKKMKNIIIIFILLLIAIFSSIIGINLFKSINGSSVEKIDEEYIEKNPWLFDETSTSETNSLGYSNNTLQAQNHLNVLPNFIGEQIKDLQGNKLYSSKLNFIIEKEFSESIEGEVIQQDPQPGISLKEDKLDVILKVSRGPEYIDVPDVIGKPISEAENLLKELKIQYKIVEVYDKNYKDDVINFMNKNPGDKIIKNKEILILRIKSSQLKNNSTVESSSSPTSSTSVPFSSSQPITDQNLSP